ncbi:TonB-dependent receptor [Pseudorhodobacter sp.]|uniref:TonB-dependent receptor n=2 Tax=Pseudorhodobacter sp. TaxID=1934400 RepID=UPI002AFF2243|nr:TonB-dependent receptor [Pseudorhodobacter sp.]
MTPSGKILLRVLLLGTALTTATPLRAETDYLNLGSITLIGTGLPTEVMENPASIAVIEGGDLKKTAPVSVAGLLRDVPGVQISEEGIERVAIRGETSRRVAIMIDGQKLTDHTNYGQPVMVDPTQIERIEVLRGSSSVVSGSRAIGGVINIVTKKGGDKAFSLTTTAGYMSATEGYRTSISAGGMVDLGAGKLDYRVSLGKMNQGNRDTPDGVLAPSGVADQTAALDLGYQLGNHSFGMKTQAYDLSADVYTGDPDFIISLPHRDLRKASAFYEGTNLTPWLDTLHLDVYHQTIDREFNNDVTVAFGPSASMNVLSTSLDAQKTSGVNLRAELHFSENSRTLVGLEYEDDSLTSDKTTVTTIMSSSTARRYDKAQIKTMSAYGQHEMDLSDTLTATVGARWYDVTADHLASTTNGVANALSSNTDSLVLGSAGLVWSRNENLALRANLSQGYIYPTLGQLFLTTTGGGVTLTGNPDLNPETATTFEVGARYQEGGRVLDATLFYTDAKDYIATVISGRSGTYQNVDAAKSWGLEVYAEQDLNLWGLTAYGSVAAMRRKLGYANGYETFDSGTPAMAGKIGLRKGWERGDMSGSFDVFVRGESGVDFRNDGGTVIGSAGGYGTLNMRADMDLGHDLSLVAEVNNITDRSYTSYEEMKGAERSINLFLTKTF